MKISKRLKICFEVLFLRSGHKHPAQEKQISVFQNGYSAGLDDARFEYANELESCYSEIKDKDLIIEEKHNLAMYYKTIAEKYTGEDYFKSK